MSWYSFSKHLIKIAGPIDKIRKYNIKNSSMKLLILLNENSIRWNGYSYNAQNAAGEIEEMQIGPIKNEEDINKFLQLSALPNLFSKADPKSRDNNYMKSANIDVMYHHAKKNNIFDLDLQRAFAMNQQEKDLMQKVSSGLAEGKQPEQIMAENNIGPEDFKNYHEQIARSELAAEIQAGRSVEEIAAENNIPKEEIENQLQAHKKQRTAGEKFYLGVINRQKKERFSGWTSLYQDHPEFQQNPAFAYLLTKSIFDSSDSKTINPPPLPDLNSAFGMLAKINNVKFGNPQEEDMLKNVVKSLQEPKLNKGLTIKEAMTEASVVAAMDNKFEKPNAEARFKEKFGVEVSDILKFGEQFQQVITANKIEPDQAYAMLEQNKLRNMKFIEEYNNEMNIQFLKKSEKTFDGNDGWIKLPRKDKTQPRLNADGTQIPAEQVFEENLDKLEQLSIPNAWCTTRGLNGKKYLTAGDFWILVDKGRAAVGIRFGGSNIDPRAYDVLPVGDDILEIAGDQSGRFGRSCPTKYWKEITNIIFAEGLENRITNYAIPHWQQILQQKTLNQSFFNPDGSVNAEEIAEFRKLVISDPDLYNRIDSEQFRQNPEALEYLKQACKEGWFNKIQKFRVTDAIALAQDVAANAQNMPDFVLKDPAFQEIVHKSLAAAYKDEPLNAQSILDQVPDHWNFYPQGKELFKAAVIKKYSQGMFWKANTYGYAKKTPQEKREIDSAKIDFEKIQNIIGKYAPDINQDPAFEAQINQAKNASVQEIMKKGFIAVDMPSDLINTYFADPEVIESLSEKYANKISNAHAEAYSRQTQDTVILDKFMDREINSTVPPFVRKTPAFQQLSKLTKRKVLQKNIGRFKAFEQHYKDDPEVYGWYKQHAMGKNPLGTKLKQGDEFFDEKLRNDPEFQAAINNYGGNIDGVAKTVGEKPSLYLTLPPEIQQNEKVKQAYLKSRVFGSRLNVMRFPREFSDPRFPAFLKQEPNVVQKYIEITIHLLKTARPKTDYYLDCSQIDPIAFGDPTIIEICQARKTPLNAPAQLAQQPKPQENPVAPIQQKEPQQPIPPLQACVNSWYNRAILSVFN